MASNAENISIWWRHHEHGFPSAIEITLMEMGEIDQYLTTTKHNKTLTVRFTAARCCWISQFILNFHSHGVKFQNIEPTDRICESIILLVFAIANFLL